MTDQIIASSGSVALRRLENTDEDMALLLSWLTNDKVVARVYAEGAPWTAEKIRRAFVGKTRATGTAGCIILREGAPVGYLQFYPVRRDSYLASTYALSQLRNAYGVDMFIGDPQLWRRGIGRQAFGALETLLRGKGARMLCADPASDNEIGLRFWPKMGFDPLEVIEDADDPSSQYVLMLKNL